jgi:2-dehydropantoate 2-reductase
MKLCIYGGGAIGGYLAVELHEAGHEVFLIARGPHLQAVRQKGLTLLIGERTKVARIPASEDPAEAGPQDSVILTLKAHSVPAIVDKIGPLLREDTTVITAQNGVPWWYFHKLEGPWENQRLSSVDPGGRIWDVITPERAIGCVVYPSCVVEAPGIVRHQDGRRIMLGEPDGSSSERVKDLSRALTGAGFKAPVRPRIRDDIWLKLWGNVSFNPISVLTHATLEQMAGDPPVRKVVRDIMLESQAVAEKLGVRFSVDVDTRIDWGGDVGAHKTSMLQDLERGRPLEIDALVASVAELGRLVGVATPTIDAVLALVRLRARVPQIETGAHASRALPS